MHRALANIITATKLSVMPANITKAISPVSITTATPKNVPSKKAPRHATRGFLFSEGGKVYNRAMSSSRWNTSSFGNWL